MLEADLLRGELQVACTAPIPGHAVRALARLTQMSVEPMLVADDQLPGLINVYSTVGQGTSIKLYLPVAEGADPGFNSPV